MYKYVNLYNSFGNMNFWLVTTYLEENPNSIHLDFSACLLMRHWKDFFLKNESENEPWNGLCEEWKTQVAKTAKLIVDLMHEKDLNICHLYYWSNVNESWQIFTKIRVLETKDLLLATLTKNSNFTVTTEIRPEFGYVKDVDHNTEMYLWIWDFLYSKQSISPQSLQVIITHGDICRALFRGLSRIRYIAEDGGEEIIYNINHALNDIVRADAFCLLDAKILK